MRRKYLFGAMVLLCLGCFVFSGYKVFTLTMEYRAGEKTYDSFQQYVVHEAEVSVPTIGASEYPEEESTEQTEPPETEGETINYPVVDFDALLEINSDVVAWVCIEDTNINYPVVQGKDNARYLAVMIDGTPNFAGSIFMDYRNEPGFTDQNTVLYGHYLENNTMFTGIKQYTSQEYYESHPDILIMTPERNYRFEIVAGYVARITDSAWQRTFSSEEEQQQWIEDAISRSCFVSAVTPEPGDRFLTLSTCSYEFHNARFVLVAVLKD